MRKERKIKEPSDGRLFSDAISGGGLQRRNNVAGIAGDEKLLVGRDDPHTDAGAFLGDAGLLLSLIHI